MKDLKNEGYLEAMAEISIVQEENSVFEQDFERFKSFIFAKAEVYGGRWWVGFVTYQDAVERRMKNVLR